MLTLPIKQKWFDMIMSGEKLEEYRDIKPYWTKRLNVFKTRIDVENKINSGEVAYLSHFVDQCKIRAGYNSTSPTALITYWLDIGTGQKEWGADSDVEYYRLHIVNKELE